MEEDEKDKNKINEQNNNGEENNDEFLQIGNLNINQEIDIKENPKKHIAEKKKHILKNSLDDGYFEPSENITSKKQNKKCLWKRFLFNKFRKF